MLLALAAMLAMSAPPLAPPISVLVFRGNVVMNEEVYRAVLDLPPEAPATTANARLVSVRLADFLQRSGYELSTVRARAEGGNIVVEIDEGRLDKVIVLGQGAFNTLRVKLQLSLPHNVFNRPQLDRQLAQFAKRFGLSRCEWSLVPVQSAIHVGPQIDEIDPLSEMYEIPQQRPYELHIVLEGREWQTGLSPELALNSFEGLGLGARWRGEAIAFSKDRLEFRSRVAATIRETIVEKDTDLVLSRALLESRYHTPPIVGKSFRTFLWLRGDFLNRLRPDIAVESFFYLTLESSLNIEYALSEQFQTSLGAGVEHRRIFQIDDTPMTPPELIADTPRRQTRPFAVLASELWLNPDEVRRDKKHLLTLEGRVFLPAERGRKFSFRLDYAYQKIFRWGWHELWLKSRGSSLQGDVLFPDEQPVGGAHLRGPFVNTFYSNRVASVSVDARFSLVRDLFKMSIYHDGVAFRALHLVPPRKRAFFADAFGLGLHVLIIDAFQLDAYYGFGFASGDRFDHGFALTITQAF